MPLTTLGKNAALDGLRTSATHMGLFSKGADITAVTGVTSTDTFTKTAHGLSNGDLVTLSGLTGGSGLVAGDPYFVIGVTANTFQLSLTSGGSAVDLGTDVTAATVNKWTELSGGSPAYARKAITWNSAGNANLDDSSSLGFDVPAGGVVDAQSLHSALTTGNLLALSPVTRETFGAQGTYTETDYDVNATS